MNLLIFDSEFYELSFALFSLPEKKVNLAGFVRDINTPSTSFIIENKKHFLAPTQNYTEVLRKIYEIIKEYSLNNIDIIGHRVVHGADKYNAPVVITDDVFNDIKKFMDFAPEHNFYNIECIAAAKNVFPEKIPNYAVFDTSLYVDMPIYSRLYGLPYNLIQKYNIRKYGFHGISHNYMAKKIAEFVNRPLTDLKLITMHLGHGCSITAIKYGKILDTTMGFSPQEGLIMEKRCGDIDSDLLNYILIKEGISIKELNTILYRFSGLYGLSGGISSIDKILDEAEKGNQIAKNAIDTFVYRIKKYVGAFYTILEGIDLIGMTGILINNAPKLRKIIFENLNFLGIEIDEKLNNEKVLDIEGEISNKSSKIKVFYIRQNIKLGIAIEIWNTIR